MFIHKIDHVGTIDSIVRLKVVNDEQKTELKVQQEIIADIRRHLQKAGIYQCDVGYSDSPHEHEGEIAMTIHCNYIEKNNFFTFIDTIQGVIESLKRKNQRNTGFIEIKKKLKPQSMNT